MTDTSREVAHQALRSVYDRQHRLVSFDEIVKILDVYTRHQFDPDSAHRELVRLVDALVEDLSGEDIEDK